MEATLNHQVMDERRECGEPHARAHSPHRGGAGRRARAHDMRVNGPPKSGPSPCGGAAKVFGKRLHATARDLLTSSTQLILARANNQ
jgi:hypothetical protein